MTKKLSFHLIRMVDGKADKDMVNEQGKEELMNNYMGITFGNIIGSVILTRHFYQSMALFERVKIGEKVSSVTGRLRNVYENQKVGETVGWDSIKRMLDGRPVACDDKAIQKIKSLVDKGAKQIWVFTKSMALGIHSWDFNNPEKKPFYEKWFGKDEWLCSASEIKPDYEKVNKVLKKLARHGFRVRTSNMLIQRVFRRDLW